MQKQYNLLVINPGSTSTKVAYFKGHDCISSKTLSHRADELEAYDSVISQYPLRENAITEYLKQENIKLEDLDAIVGRGGLLKPLKGGTYKINALMLEDLKASKYGQHASNLGAVLADELAAPLSIPAYIVNPVVVDELEPLARISGMPEIPRKSVFHALNQKAVAMKAAKEMGRSYNGMNVIVAHLGGGISVAAHKQGRVIDVNDGIEEGPFSPERTGTLPVKQLAGLCYSGKYTKAEIDKKLAGKGGLVAYLGTSDCREIESMIFKGDKNALLCFQAMAYQVSKEIGACAAVLSGTVDAILITGGVARSQMFVDWITERVSFIAPVRVYPGEDEMSAMAEGAIRVMDGEEQAQEYV